MTDSIEALLVRGDSAVSVKRLTPTTICSPDSMRATRSAWLATRRLLSSSMALNAPPRSRISSSSPRAATVSSWTLASITWEPAKMSGYSSRSLS